MKTAASPKLIEDLANRIQAKIVAGEYPPGTRLKQEVLAQQFDVSRTPIREALSRLEAKDRQSGPAPQRGGPRAF